jgi:hypothetical protein
MPADFSGEWQMDLESSDDLGAVLQELGVPLILAAVIKRLGVTQCITQDDREVAIEVKTMLGTDALRLDLDGKEGLLPGIGGGRTAACSTWLDGGERLETRQRIDGAGGGVKDSDATLFVTTRSLLDGGSSLLEHCAVVKSGVLVEEAVARRILRRLEGG